ncbi:MAG: NAD(P)/FAD-dependent oxidoreductase, partial [Terriglobales bacterium]
TLVTGVERGRLTAGGEAIAAETVLWAAGVLASPLGRTLGVALDAAGRVAVSAELALPWRPEVFVLGDLAALPGRDGRLLPGLAPVAMQQGRAAAASIKCDLRGQPRRPFRYVDKGNLATIGRAQAVADIAGLQLSGLVAWLVWISVHILYLIGFRNRILVAMEWSWDYLSFQQAARLITGRIHWTSQGGE